MKEEDVINWFIFENGLTFKKKQNGTFYISSSESNKELYEKDMFALSESLNLEHVCIASSRGINFQKRNNYHLFSRNAEKKQSLGFQLASFTGYKHLFNQSATKVMDLAYVIEAMIYHCMNIALIYSDNSVRFAETSKIIETDSDNFWFQNGYGAYYEFDALITVSRRVFEAVSSLLWDFYGNQKGGRPGSFARCLKKLEMPEGLWKYISDTWEIYGVKIKDYRDCIQHHTPINFLSTQARMTRIKEDIWVTSFILPVNPESKSRKRLIFPLDSDLLDYSWKIVSELFNFAEAIMVNLENLIQEKT